MRPSEIAMTLGNMSNEINLDIQKARDVLVHKYEPDRKSFDNEEISEQIELHTEMVNLLIHSLLASTFTKSYDETKKLLDNACIKAGLDPDGEAGTTKLIKDNGALAFSKRQNKDGEQTTLKDFIIELQKLDVSKSVIDKAMERATKVKRGNVYYIVNGSDT